MLDTGAAISVIDVKVIPGGLRGLRKTAEPPEVASASGHPLPAIGTYKLPLKLGSRTFWQDVTVLENLDSRAILGIDFLNMHDAVINLGQNTISVPGGSGDVTNAAVAEIRFPINTKKSENGRRAFMRTEIEETFPLQLLEDITIHPMSEKLVSVTHLNQTGQPITCLARGPGIIEAIINLAPDEPAKISFRNESNTEIKIFKKEKIAVATPLNCEIKNLRPKADAHPGTACSFEKERYLREQLQLNHLDTREKEELLEVIFRNHDVFSASKLDLGHANALPHKIKLTDEAPVHVKQFRIPWAHQEFLNSYIEDLLKAGVIEPSRSSFNAPLFCVPKGTDGKGLRLVLDYRRLNEKTVEDKYVMREVQECIDEVGRSGSKVFSALDLTAGFYQQELEPSSRPYTAFTLPGRGRFQFATSSMGLTGAPSSFSKLMDLTIEGATGLLVYLDDILAHSATFRQHLAILENCFSRLRRMGLKLNPSKCSFIAKEVPYLGFVLTAEGVKASAHKGKAIREFPEPTSVKKVREFLGLTNYFRRLIPQYSILSAKLSRLLTKAASWKGGQLPPDAKQAFLGLKERLLTAPVLAYPSPNRPFILTTDASTGSADQSEPGGIGAVLSQIDPITGQEKAVDYASRSLKPFEKNYSAFMLEMSAASWAMEHYYHYLYGNFFYLDCDHRPLEKLSARQTKTLNRLQELMLKFNFTIRYKKGKENSAADALSRNAISEIKTIGLSEKDLRRLQATDGFCQAIHAFKQDNELPVDKNQRRFILRNSRNCFKKDGIWMFRLQRTGRMPKEVLILPKDLRDMVFQAFHTHMFAGHFGAEKTTMKILENYWWPTITADILDRVQRCITCAMAKRPNQYKKRHAPFSSLRVPDAPNQRVHIDLFGPLKTSESGKKYVLSASDAFSKRVTLVGLPDKSAEVVAKAFFENYICKYSCPKVVVSDRGQEFCAKLSEQFFKLMGIEHAKTASYHPQMNSNAEVFNKEIQKYMRVIMEDGNTLDWEKYLAPLELSYNTMVHKSTLVSPFYLTFLQEPRLPFFDPAQEKTLYLDDYPTACMARLRVTHRLAAANQRQNNDSSLRQRNKGAQHVEFFPDQPVLVAFPVKELQGNPKLKKPYAQGYVIHEKIGDYTYIVRNVNTGRRYTIHADLLRDSPETRPVTNATVEVEKSRTQKPNPGRQMPLGIRAEYEGYEGPETNQEPEKALEETEDTQSMASSSDSFESADEDGIHDERPAQVPPEASTRAGLAQTASPARRFTRSRGRVEDEPLVPLHPPEYKRRSRKT